MNPQTSQTKFTWYLEHSYKPNHPITWWEWDDVSTNNKIPISVICTYQNMNT